MPKMSWIMCNGALSVGDEIRKVVWQDQNALEEELVGKSERSIVTEMVE